MDKQGRHREYSSAYLRRTYREGKQVRNETVANLSALPEEVVDWIEATLKGKQLVPAGSEFTITRSLPHGHVAAVAAMAHQLGLPALLGPACRARDIALALIVSRVVRPASKLSTLTWWPDTTLGVDLGVAGACTDEVYAAMDWLADRQEAIEKKLAARHLGPVGESGADGVVRPDQRVGDRAVLRAGRARLLPRRQERLRADRVRGAHRPGGPPGRGAGVSRQHRRPGRVHRDRHRHPRHASGIARLVLVGDRGMITSARIEALRELNEDPDTATDFGWITALRAPAIAKLAADDGPLQMSLFDTQDLAEISHPDYPGERLIACRNPALAAERARKRRRAAGRHRQAARPDHRDRVAAGTLAGAGKIGIAVGKAIGKYKMGKHFHTTITDTSFTYPSRPGRHRRRSRPRRHLRAAHQRRRRRALDPAAVVESYKNLANVERDFRIIKTDDLDLRPIHHRLDERVRAHVLICLLACYLIWHLRKAWAPMTFTDEHPPQRENPVAAAQRSPQAPTPRHPQARRRTATRYAASAACSTTWPPSPATRSATTAPAPTCPCSPTPPPTNAAPSNSSTPRYHSPPRSQNNQTANQRIPRSAQIFALLHHRNFGLDSHPLVVCPTPSIDGILQGQAERIAESNDRAEARAGHSSDLDLAQCLG